MSPFTYLGVTWWLVHWQCDSCS